MFEVSIKKASGKVLSFECDFFVDQEFQDETLQDEQDVGGEFIMKTCPFNVYPLIPHFYTAKLGYSGVYLFSYFAPKHRLWVLVRTASPRRF